ncbi:cytochrome P450 9e2-like [Nymphalis io]|uniref:cytochrome P450 9e2-like n=1 Tax=Inachis io TaxID=171585 RepID=UPI0021691F91|nr:cytochrome P450 9e2-like [Nymphalis io]
MILLIWTVVLVMVLTLFFRQTYSKFSKHGVKNLKIVPFFGNMLKVFLRKEHFVVEMEKMYKQFPNERFVGRYEFIKPMIVLQDLELIKNITIKDFEHFLDHRGFTDDSVEPLFARNLFSLKGQEWKDMRSTLSPAFTSSKIKLMVPFMEEVGEQMIRAIKKKLKESENGCIEVDVKDLTSRFANDVIASCAFGLKVNSHTDEENQFYEMGKTASTFKFRQMLLFFVISAFPGLANILKLKLFSNETKRFFIDLVMGTMKDREVRNIIRPDMIHLLMEAKKGQLSHDEKNGSNNEQDTGFATVEESSVGKKTINKVWSDTDLIAQAVLFFIAGFETISIAMSFTLHELAVHPEIQERLAKEIKDYDAKNGGKLNFSSIQNMAYLDMVTSEALRLWPPVLALDRICVKDYNMGKPNPSATKDYFMRKGEILSIPVWSIHRDPKIFSNPNKFDPERFSEDNKHNINPMTYMPFGVGPRNCIGSRFALCELKVLLYQILLHTEVLVSEKTRIPVKLAPESFNPRIDGGHWLKFKARK